MPIEAADAMIQQLFTVGLALASLASIVDGPASARIAEAIDGLDQVIRDMRNVIFDQLSSHLPTQAGSPGRLQRGPIAAVTTELHRLAADLNQAARGDHAVTTLAYEDAMRAVCRANVALREARAADLVV